MKIEYETDAQTHNKGCNDISTSYVRLRYNQDQAMRWVNGPRLGHEEDAKLGNEKGSNWSMKEEQIGPDGPNIKMMIIIVKYFKILNNFIN